jgi:hypothetical protein
VILVVIVPLLRKVEQKRLYFLHRLYGFYISQFFSITPQTYKLFLYANKFLSKIVPDFQSKREKKIEILFSLLSTIP